MKITFCVYDGHRNVDGPTTWIKRLLPFLKANGVETRILFFANKRWNLPTFTYFSELGYQCRIIPNELFFEEQIRMILEDLKEFPPDVFIPNYFPAACYANFWAKMAGIPSVIILHNDDVMHHSLVEQFVAGPRSHQSTAIVAVSKFIYDKTVPLNLGTVNVEYIPYGAPVPETKACLKRTDPLKMIYLGRLNNHQKRISDVTRAFCKTTKNIPGTKAVIYGAGASLPEVLSILEEEGKDAEVSYEGVVDTKDVQNRLLENHVFVLLSDYEGIPIALMEAMGCGLVPVCSDISSGIPELIVHGWNGLIVKDRNAAFMEAVQFLKDHPEKWNEFSANARQTIVERYSADTCNTRWLRMLREVAQKNYYEGRLIVPSIKTLQKLVIREEFLTTEKRKPGIFHLPFLRLRKTLGRIARDLFKR